MPDGPRPKGPNYEDDFYGWTQYQAQVLRALPTADNRFDREHLAEDWYPESADGANGDTI